MAAPQASERGISYNAELYMMDEVDPGKFSLNTGGALLTKDGIPLQTTWEFEDYRIRIAWNNEPDKHGAVPCIWIDPTDVNVESNHYALRWSATVVDQDFAVVVHDVPDQKLGEVGGFVLSREGYQPFRAPESVVNSRIREARRLAPRLY